MNIWFYDNNFNSILFNVVSWFKLRGNMNKDLDFYEGAIGVIIVGFILLLRKP